jgi:hypothetical protein
MDAEFLNVLLKQIPFIFFILILIILLLYLNNNKKYFFDNVRKTYIIKIQGGKYILNHFVSTYWYIYQFLSKR